MARPKRVFTEREIKLIGYYALNGGKNNTIATALDMPVNTLTNRFTKLLQKNRAIRKLKLAHNQTRQSKTNTDMAKFLGKNELGQVDKQEIKTETDKPTLPLTTEEIKELKRLAGLASNIKVRPPEGLQEAG